MKTFCVVCAAVLTLSACSTRQSTALIYGAEGSWHNAAGKAVVTPLTVETGEIKGIEQPMEPAPPAYQPTKPAEPDLPVKNLLPPKYFL